MLQAPDTTYLSSYLCSDECGSAALVNRLLAVSVAAAALAGVLWTIPWYIFHDLYRMYTVASHHEFGHQAVSDPILQHHIIKMSVPNHH